LLNFVLLPNLCTTKVNMAESFYYGSKYRVLSHCGMTPTGLAG